MPANVRLELLATRIAQLDGPVLALPALDVLARQRVDEVDKERSYQELAQAGAATVATRNETADSVAKEKIVGVATARECDLALHDAHHIIRRQTIGLAHLLHKLAAETGADK